MDVKEDVELKSLSSLDSLTSENFKNLIDHLGLKETQFGVLSVVYKLNMNERPSTARDILDEYVRCNGASDDELDLSVILEGLRFKGFIVLTDASEYIVDSKALENAIEYERKEVKREADNLEAMRTHLDDFLSTPPIDSKPYVVYLGIDELFEHMVESVKTARKCFIVANFPVICYPRELADGLGETRRGYIELLQQRCSKGYLNLVYLTRLGVEEPFNRAVKIFGDYDTAFKEVGRVLDRLEDQIRSFKGLDIRYLKHPFGLDGCLPIVDTPNEFYLFLRDPKRSALGGIYVRDQGIAQKIMDQYEQAVNDAKKLTEDDNPVEKLRDKLQQKYEKLIETKT